MKKDKSVCTKCKVNPRHVTKGGNVNSYCIECERERQATRKDRSTYQIEYRIRRQTKKEMRYSLIELRLRAAKIRYEMRHGVNKNE